MSFLQLFKSSFVFSFALCIFLNIIALVGNTNKLNITPENIGLQILVVLLFAVIISAFVKFVLWIIHLL